MERRRKIRNWLRQHLDWLLAALACVSLALAWLLHTMPAVRYRSLKPVAGMTEAGIYYISWTAKPRDVLVVAGGYNDTSGGLIRLPQWQEWAERNQLALVELAFASEEKDLSNGKGYYYVVNGSGTVLLQAIADLWGDGPLPIVIFGFSGGAHFSSRLSQWCPERVAGWAAYSAGWWDEPQPDRNLPPGMVICGDADPRFQASSQYFLDGRRCGYRWLWVGLENGDHCLDHVVIPFVIDYFDRILKGRPGEGVWIDLETRQREVPAGTLAAVWLPDRRLLEPWRRLSQVEPAGGEKDGEGL